MKKIGLFLIMITVLLSNTLPPINYDPFYKAQKLLKKPKRVQVFSKPIQLKVYAIYNNRAYINGKFYKIGDKIAGYKLYKIYDNYVVLKSKSKLKVVYLIKNRILKMRNK